jgi:hypothetical protein
MGLPECHSRRVVNGDETRFFCAHPAMHAPDSVVHAGICRACDYWRLPAPDQFRPFPPPPPGADPAVRILSFHHGLGDCVQFAHLLRVYRSRGFEFSVRCEKRKALVFEAAGVPCVDVVAKEYKVRWPHLPGFNLPTPTCEWSSNKAAQNVGVGPLPALGPPGEVWEQLCAVDLEGAPERLLTADVAAEADRFLAGLPRPVVLIHTSGQHLVEKKNLPAETVQGLYRLLLDRTDGSVVILDWDGTTPGLQHGRVRHLGRDWGPVSLLELYALMRRADLLIGVDSGPFHFAALTHLPALGVFHEHYPSCVALPRAKNVLMARGSGAYQAVNHARRRRWNIVEYEGPLPTVEEIGRHAARMLEGPRYGLPLGRDVMVQQWVRDWSLTRTALAPLADRNKTMDFVLRHMPVSPTVVETGCIRSPEDWSAGYSTYLFAALLDGRPGRLISVDRDAAHCAFARRTVWGSPEVVHADSVEWLRSFREPIDVLYLDSLDAHITGHAEHGLAEARAAEDKLHDHSLVVFDDTVYDRGQWRGKGALGVPYLAGRGWAVRASGYQTVLGRRGPQPEA